MSDRPVLVELGEVLGRNARVVEGAWRWDTALRDSVWVAPADVCGLELTTVAHDADFPQRVGLDAAIVLRAHGDSFVTTLAPAVIAALLGGADG